MNQIINKLLRNTVEHKVTIFTNGNKFTGKLVSLVFDILTLNNKGSIIYIDADKIVGIEV